MNPTIDVPNGMYLLNPGDDASVVARRTYGDVHKASLILEHNDTDWSKLDRVMVPSRPGRLTTLQEGESRTQVIERMFPGHPPHLFFKAYDIWNGGADGWLKPGDMVYVPER